MNTQLIAAFSEVISENLNSVTIKICLALLVYSLIKYILDKIFSLWVLKRQTYNSEFIKLDVQRRYECGVSIFREIDTLCTVAKTNPRDLDPDLDIKPVRKSIGEHDFYISSKTKKMIHEILDTLLMAKFDPKEIKKVDSLCVKLKAEIKKPK